MNAVVQDAFLGCGTKSPYLAIFNHKGLRSNENAPKHLPEEMMRMIGPNDAVKHLEQEVEAHKLDLQQRYGRPSYVPADEEAQYTSKVSELRTARQKDQR
ncbi:hypothetical protein Ct61P_14551 [Colletotrichum tofieldiae]|nr:hypothetical protein Ct61P_14551 [Colletotrichum tofieldiae]